MPTIAGLFRRYEDANLALHDLNEMGYDSGDISVVAPDEGPRLQEIRSLFHRYHAIDMETRQSETAHSLDEEQMLMGKKPTGDGEAREE